MHDADDRFRRHFAASRIPTVIWARRGEEFVFAEVNAAAAEIAGTLIENLIGVAASEMYRDRPDMLELMDRAWRLRVPLTLDAPIRVLLDGREMIFRVDVAILPPDHLLMHAIDITAQFVAEEELRAKERRHQILFEEASDGIVRLDDLGRVIEANPAAAEMLGYDRAALIGVYLFETARDEDLPPHAAAGKPSFVSERSFQRPDGTAVPIELSGRSLAEGGQVLFLRDVTARRERENALRLREATEQLSEREQLLSTVLDRLPIAVVVSDESGLIVRSNPAGDAIWGFHRTHTAMAAPHTYRAWWVETGEPLAQKDWASTRALERGETSINELLEIETGDGTHRIIMNSALPLMDESGGIRGAVVLNQDVTEMRSLVQQREAMAARLREVISSTSDGICTISADGRATLVSPAAAAMGGVPAEALLGADLHSAIHGGDGSVRENAFAEVREGAARCHRGDEEGGGVTQFSVLSSQFSVLSSALCRLVLQSRPCADSL